MANTYTLISSNVLTGSAASVTFSSIPSTYTDLVVRLSARTSGSQKTVPLTFNSDSGTNYSRTTLYTISSSGVGASANSANTALIGNIYITNSTDTASTFGSMEIYIPSYTAAQTKPVSSFGVEENNGTTSGIAVVAGQWRSNSAITSLTLTANGESFEIGSSFYLYGIKNS